MHRRHFMAWAGLTVTPLHALASGEEKVGILMLHGKNPGSNQDPSMTPLKTAFERKGWRVLFPDMPWSRNRYLDGHWDLAMQEMGAHVKTLQDQGATRIVLVGHSLGVPASLSHAARGGVAHGLVLLAPGHVPRGYYTAPHLKPVRESIDDARAKVAAGQGDRTERFTDINQNRQQTVATTAKNFLSYFDPASDADMGMTAPRVPPNVPVLTAIGEADPMFKFVRSYYVDKLPPNPKSRYLEVGGGHLDTPRLAQDQVIAWIEQSVLSP